MRIDDQSSRRIVMNYVMMPDKPQFCASDVAAATGVVINTSRNELAILEHKGFIVRANKRINGCVYYRVATDTELEQKAKLYLSQKETKSLRNKILKRMTPGCWYSSLTLRADVGVPEVDFSFLKSMAEDGCLEMETKKLCDGGAISYYWRKGELNAKS